MSISHSVLAAGLALSLAGAAPAEPDRPHPPEMPVEAKIERLETAARQLAEAGMVDESTRLRVQAAAMRRDLQPHRPELAEREAMIESLREENRRLQQRLEQLEAEDRARTATHQTAASLDQLAAEAHRKQTAETWDRIQRAGRGPRPLPAAPPDQALPLEAPQPLHPAGHDEVPRHTPRSDQALLEDILRTLQRIEEKMAD